ncbi:hypothetical protein [Alkalicoccobacillus porphyridii]|uniref:Pilus assembly protein PilO n=1 Tax=Alkalicoccobacillus porphyridii TaxID=2597270 RepID=A0A553ZXQ8_9BACI|nr:hypothetical protein [Alkalicoccobacillus porphyridii]TSB46237.1 hypothetical protein FN960_12820 [Alkalicoccobacillus porphyridii]
MRIYMTKQRWLMMIAVIGFIIAGCVLSYWQFIKPAQSRLVSAQDDVAIAQLELEAASNQDEVEVTDPSPLSSTALQQRLPVVPLEDEVILAFAQAEAVADVEIIQVNYQGNQNFPTSNRVMTFNEEEDELIEEANVDLEEDEPTVEVETEPIIDSTLIADWTIPHVEPIQALVQLRTSNYRGIAQFIQELEQFPRMLSIDSISYDSFKEQQDAGVEDEVVTEYFDFYVMVSSFYYPSLAETLSETAPFRSYPDSSEKEDPLYPR